MGHRHIYTEPPRGKAKAAAIKAAYGKLTAKERQVIDSLARYCCKRGIRDFGPAAALEFLGKLGMILEERLNA